MTKAHIHNDQPESVKTKAYMHNGQSVTTKTKAHTLYGRSDDPDRNQLERIPGQILWGPVSVAHYSGTQNRGLSRRYV